MPVEVSQTLQEQLQTDFTKGYRQFIQNSPVEAGLAETIGSQLGIFYLLGEASSLDKTRVLSFEVDGQRHATYFHWSEDLAIQGAQSSRFFLLLTEFGLLSGIEIHHSEGVEEKIWQDFLGEKSVAEISASLSNLQEKGHFSKDLPLITKYAEILQSLAD